MGDNPLIRNEFLFYSSQDGTTNIQVLVEDETIWLTQKDMAEVFDTSIQNVNKHLLNIFNSLELQENSVIKKKLITASDGKAYKTAQYNLDAIIGWNKGTLPFFGEIL